MLNRSAALTNKAASSSVIDIKSSTEKKITSIKSTMIFENVAANDHKIISNEEILQSSLKNDDLEVFFTDDTNLLSQYYALRQECFDEVDRKYRDRHPEDCMDWEEYDGSENLDDRAGKILVVVDNNGIVVGGMRFLLSDWVEYTMNEEPSSGFTIKNFLKKNNFDCEAKYCECDDIVLKKSHRTIGAPKMIFAAAVKEAIKYGCQYIVGIAIKVSARNDKIILNSLGYKAQVMLDYPWIRQKDHGYEARYPLVVDLNSKN